MKRLKWVDLMDDVDYKAVAHVGKRQFVFAVVTDMDDACGKDNEGHPKFLGEVDFVDLASIPRKEIESAIRSCGWEDMDPGDDLMLAEVCHSHGLKAPLHSESGNGFKTLVKAMKADARALASSEAAMEHLLDRPVNAIGSSAREFMAGDIFSGLQRGVVSGDKKAGIIAKMYGVPDHIIEEAGNTRPKDWMPYFMGYVDGHSGRSPEQSDDLAPEYTQGYNRGVAVREGKASKPNWINGGT